MNVPMISFFIYFCCFVGAFVFRRFVLKQNRFLKIQTFVVGGACAAITLLMLVLRCLGVVGPNFEMSGLTKAIIDFLVWWETDYYGAVMSFFVLTALCLVLVYFKVSVPVSIGRQNSVFKYLEAYIFKTPYVFAGYVASVVILSLFVSQDVIDRENLRSQVFFVVSSGAFLFLISLGNVLEGSTRVLRDLYFAKTQLPHSSFKQIP